MQEIAHGIYLETAFPGVTLGAISLAHGMIMVDAPPRPDDARIWRSMLLNLGGGVERLLVNLDAHFDRTLGARAMECTVLAHEQTALLFRTRPSTFKPQATETGAEWEQISGLGSLRWVPPELTFTNRMVIHWGESSVELEYHPGPNPGAIWVLVPKERVVFIGDAVIVDQPPFLAGANLEAWIADLEMLHSPAYSDHLLVSGRGGLVAQDQILRQIYYLNEVSRLLKQVEVQKAGIDTAVHDLVPSLLRLQEIPAARREQFTQRLRWGLQHYFDRGHHTPTVEEESE
jgi:cyclase